MQTINGFGLGIERKENDNVMAGSGEEWIKQGLTTRGKERKPGTEPNANRE